MFKGVSIDFVWAPATILFGPNDAGTTNILELLEFAFGNDVFEPRADVFADVGEPVVVVDLELDGRDLPGHDDNLGLAALLQYGCSWLFWRDDFDQIVEAEGNAASMRWELGEGEPFILADDSEPLDLQDLIARLREEVVHGLDVLTSASSAEVQRFVDALLASRWFRCERQVTMRHVAVSWLTPPADAVPPDVLAAARAIADGADHAGSLLVRAASAMARTGTHEGFFDFEVHALRPFDLVQPRRTAASVEGFVDAIYARLVDVVQYVLEHFDGPERWDAYVPKDVWLEEVEDAAVRVAPAVLELCEAVSVRATDLAPAFVSDNYRIAVDALSPADWTASGGRRLRVTLERHDTNEKYPLPMVGSGVATWAMYALDEATRRVRREGEGMSPDLLPEGRFRDSFIRQRRALYLIDEPEQNLHPLAQHDAAAFLARMAADGNDVVAATHSPTFLAIPAAETQYAHVRRVAGWTTLTVLGARVIEQLDRAGDDSGLSRSDLLQLTRGFLLVEGLHDKLVVEHFFAEELAAARIHMLAFRGARETAGLLDAQLLIGLGLPICVMLDRTSDEFVNALNRRRIRPTDATTPEERQLVKLAGELHELPPGQVHFVPLRLHDIIAALPEGAVRRVAPQFRAWKPIVSSYEQAKSHENFKAFALREIGYTQGATPFVKAALVQTSEERASPAPQLRRAVADAIAFVTSRH
jgi:hypothetical protein